MLLEPSDDQEFFRETTARFLTDQVPPAELRRLRDDPVGHTADYWRRGAELGWTSLLVGEEHGGGSISGAGLVDLALVAFEFGRHAAPGPLVPCSVVAGALSAADHHLDVVGGLLDGSVVAAWCRSAGGTDPTGPAGVEIRVDGDDVVVDGRVRPVESAASADQLLVAGRTGDGWTQVLVPADADGVTRTPMRGIDLTRRFAVVDFDRVRMSRDMVVGEPGGAGDAVDRQLRHALVIDVAEAVGAMQAAFDMTVEWAFDRYSFGRPLASYQALKHRFADMTTWLEAGHAISDEAAAAVAADEPHGAELTAAAASFVGQYGTELLQECVQLHGGIGVTFEHDLHFFLRRVTLAAALYGTPADHLLTLTDLVQRREARS